LKLFVQRQLLQIILILLYINKYDYFTLYKYL